MWSPDNPLTTRWTDAEQKRINRDFGRRAFRFLDDLPRVRHGVVDYVDLRGFPFTSEIGTDLTRVDFTDCNMQFGGIGRQIRLTQCRFVGARLWAVIGYDVRGCDFTAAHMKNADLRGKFRDCVFADANLVGAQSDPESRFLRCDFSRARLRNVRWYDVVFTRCNWEGAKFGTGSVAGSRFVGTRPTPEQFGETILGSDISKKLMAEIKAEVEAEFRRRAAEKGRRTRKANAKRRSP